MKNLLLVLACTLTLNSTTLFAGKNTGRSAFVLRTIGERIHPETLRNVDERTGRTLFPNAVFKAFKSWVEVQDPTTSASNVDVMISKSKINHENVRSLVLGVRDELAKKILVDQQLHFSPKFQILLNDQACDQIARSVTDKFDAEFARFKYVNTRFLLQDVLSEIKEKVIQEAERLKPTSI